MKSVLLSWLLLVSGSTFGEARSPYVSPTKIQRIEIGQLLIIGISGTQINAYTKAKIQELRPGGIILFSKNIKTAQQLAKLTFDLQSFARSISLPPFFIAVDQEGGSVTRLKSWPPLPSAAALGRAGDVDLAFKTAFFTGQMMQTLGLNMNLAPVLDLGDAYRPTFLGSRAYHHDPLVVERMGSYALAGYKAAGILAVAKHYPGHGAAAGDSHHSLPTSPLSEKIMNGTHSRPFEDVLREGLLSAVMAAHVSYPNLDPTRLPATFSKIILEGHLRRRLGFKGLILTDDVEMQGAKKFASAADRSVAAIEAGADLVMVAWNRNSQYSAHQGLTRAYQKGRLSAERLQASLARIAEFKSHLENPHLPTPAEIRSMVYHRELYQAIDSVASGNLRRSFSSRIELGRDISVLTDSTAFLSDIRASVKGSGVHFDLLQISSLSQLSQQLGRYPRNVALFIHVQDRQNLQRLLQLSSKQKERIILVSDDLPSQIKSVGGFQQAVLSYTRHPNLGKLFGKELLSMISRQRMPAGAVNEDKIR